MKLLRSSCLGLTFACLVVAATQSASPSNLDYWLENAATVPAAPTTTQTRPAATAAATSQPWSRPDALAGAVQTADGALTAGGIYTTAGKDLQLWVDAQKRWRHIPLIIVRGIRAVIVDEHIEPEWRWKTMGNDEKVYTGRSRPVRRLQWEIRLIDGTALTGVIKGQPLWVQRGGSRTLHVLHERSKGQWGQTLAQLDHPRHIVFSRGEMERIISMTEADNGP